MERTELVMSIDRIASGVAGVRRVESVHIGAEGDRLVVGVRLGLPPTVAMPQVVRIAAAVRTAVQRLVQDAAVFVEPDIVVDPSTPTEAIVIRSLD